MSDLKDVKDSEALSCAARDENMHLEVDVHEAKLGRMTEEAMDAELQQLREKLETLPKPSLQLTLSNPALFTYILVAFASMGGLLSGLDQSLISGANLYLPPRSGLVELTGQFGQCRHASRGSRRCSDPVSRQ